MVWVSFNLVSRDSHNKALINRSCLGDPNDVSLRVAERKVLIPQFMREKLVATHCRKVAVGKLNNQEMMLWKSICWN